MKGKVQEREREREGSFKTRLTDLREAFSFAGSNIGTVAGRSDG
jgi:hypothetical protein